MKESVQFDSTGGHIGNFLIMAASTYPFALGPTMESIQNALDAKARNIWIRINQKVPGIMIRDDGDGASVAKFKEALQSIGKSIKAKDKLGQFGRGLISPLDKCERFTFTSSPRGSDEFNEWTFVRKEIEAWKSFSEIPRRKRDDLTMSEERKGRGVTPVNWSTQVALSGVTDNAKINKIGMDELTQAILTRFGRVLLRLEATVNIVIINPEGKETVRDVKATTCTGHPLEEVELGKRGKRTIFTFFRALKSAGSRKGKILVGVSSDEYRVPLVDFIEKLVADEYVSKEAALALTSGVFEGEITSDLLKLAPSRAEFEHTSEFLEFCVALNQWFDHVGKKHMADAAEEKEDEMIQEIARDSLEYIERLVMSGEKDYAEFRKVIENIRVGNVGSGHKKPRKKDVVGETNEPALATGGSSTEHSGDGDGEGGGNASPETEHEEHHPFIVQGPRGRTRTLVKGGSTGLQFRFAEMPETVSSWVFNPKNGELCFNTRSAAWLTCRDKGPKHLRQLMESSALFALTLETLPEGQWRDGARALAEEYAKPFAALITQSDAFQARMKAH